ncbi:hypothetical protein ACFL5F_03230 [Planctomycetota bacterium]
MKAAKIVLVVIFSAALIRAARLGDIYPLPHALPLLGGKRPGLYDILGVLLVIAFLYAFSRIGRRKRYSRKHNSSSQVRKRYGKNSDINRNRYRQR